MSIKKIKDEEFIMWKPMNALPRDRNMWIYINADNTQFALVNVISGDVIFIIDRASNEKLYTSPNAGKLAKQSRRRLV